MNNHYPPARHIWLRTETIWIDNTTPLNNSPNPNNKPLIKINDPPTKITSLLNEFMKQESLYLIDDKGNDVFYYKMHYGQPMIPNDEHPQPYMSGSNWIITTTPLPTKLPPGWSMPTNATWSLPEDSPTSIKHPRVIITANPDPDNVSRTIPPDPTDTKIYQTPLYAPNGI